MTGCRLLLCAGVAVAGGCGWQDSVVDGEFTPEQWSKLQQELALKESPDACGLAGYTVAMRCSAGIELASELFGDPSLSLNSAVSCATCHDATHGWIDSRTPNNVSLGPTQWTKRNAMTLWNIGRKQAAGGPFGWDGGYPTIGDVVERAVNVAMQSSDSQVASVVLNNGNYRMLYNEIDIRTDDAGVFDDVKQAFTAYLAQPQFVTQPTPFDAYLAGNDTAISDSAKRGFAVFAGRGQCIDCHSGYLFSDLTAHDTGVAQAGPNVVAVDTGAGDGTFVTGTLREIASTGPYMHDGYFATLSAVIAFYRNGGDPIANYSGTRDPRMQPLDLTDQDASDLEAFLNSLTQGPPAQGSGTPPPPDAGVMPDAGPNCMPPTSTQCGNTCVDLSADMMNCGYCGHVCLPPTPVCQQGNCT